MWYTVLRMDARCIGKLHSILYTSEELNDFKGGMTENYAQLQLIANGYQTYYWESDRGAEIDFVIQMDKPCLLHRFLLP